MKTIVGMILSASDEEVGGVYEKLRAMEAKEFGKGEEYIAELLPRLAEQYENLIWGLWWHFWLWIIWCWIREGRFMYLLSEYFHHLD